jgi:hypothetical protein
MKYLVIVIILLYSLSGNSQTELGKYINSSNDYLIFLENNRIEIYFERAGCLGNEIIVGEGNYKLNNNKLRIKFDTHNKEFESSFLQIQTIPKPENSIIEFEIIDIDKNPIPFTNIVYKDLAGNFHGTSANEKGIGELKIPETVDAEIKISFVGYTYALIPTKEIISGKIVVTMNEGNTIFLDNSTMKMKVILDESNRTFKVEKLKIK